MVAVKVLYKFVDGAHFFVANDEASLGLCVASQNVEAAFDAVEVQLEKLFKLNHGKNVKFSPSMSALAFAAWVRKEQDEAASMPSPGVAGQVAWMKSAELEMA